VGGGGLRAGFLAWAPVTRAAAAGRRRPRPSP